MVVWDILQILHVACTAPTIYSYSYSYYNLMKLPVRIRQARSSLTDIMQLVHTPAPANQPKDRLVLSLVDDSILPFCVRSISCRLAAW